MQNDRKSELIGAALLAFPVLIDCINGYLQDKNGSSLIGIAYRGIILLYGVKYIFLTPYRRLTKLLLLSLFFSIAYATLSGTLNFSVVSMAFKTIYPYFLLAILFNNRFLNEHIICKYFLLNGFLSGLVLIFCFLFDAGFPSYVEGVYGTKGLFIAANDIGLSLLFADALANLMYLKTRKTIYFLLAIIISSSCCLIGSMAGFGGVGIILFLLFCSINILKFSDFKSSINQRLVSIIMLCFVLMYVISSLYTIIQEDPYLAVKYSDIQGSLLENSGRKNLAAAADDVIASFAFPDVLWGAGAKFIYEVGRTLQFGGSKGVEIDFYDIFGMFGIIFAVLVYILPIYCLFKSLAKFIKTRQIFYIWSAVAFVLYIIHSFYGGHAYTSPMASTGLVVFIYLLSNPYSLTENRMGIK